MVDAIESCRSSREPPERRTRSEWAVLVAWAPGVSIVPAGRSRVLHREVEAAHDRRRHQGTSGGVVRRRASALTEWRQEGWIVIELVLLYVGAALTAIWGISHLFPTRSVVKGFGEISVDNRRIITMEWIAEGVALIFIGVLVALVTIVDSAAAVSTAVYALSVAGLLVLAVISLFTGFRIRFLPFRLCPVYLHGLSSLDRRWRAFVAPTTAPGRASGGRCHRAPRRRPQYRCPRHRHRQGTLDGPDAPRAKSDLVTPSSPPAVRSCASLESRRGACRATEATPVRLGLP